jgi:hypothetical protein
MLYAERSSGRSHRPLTASAKVLDPSNTAHALSSHQEAQKRAIEEAHLRAEAERQQDNELLTAVASSSNLSAPASPSVSRPTSPGRRTAKEADLSFSDSTSEDDSNPHPPRPRNGKGIHFCSFFITFKLNKCTFLGRTVVDDDDDEVPNRRPPKKRMFHYIDMQNIYTQLLTQARNGQSSSWMMLKR